MKSQNIILTGFMGTGKTTVGRLLAQQLGYDFVDTDELIEARVGCSIASIFDAKGESFFRELEAQISAELAQLLRVVIATG
ncbi:MAG: shikimate kinase, partial [Candidatus Promineifilaceae bacterium]|nr:shikimate kinase [Candidatus Promineifilaceae bacterium]